VGGGAEVIVASVTLRIVTALLPLAVLKVTQVIIDDVYKPDGTAHGTSPLFWWLVALEFGLASLAAILVRLINLRCGARGTSTAGTSARKSWSTRRAGLTSLLSMTG